MLVAAREHDLLMEESSCHHRLHGQTLPHDAEWGVVVLDDGPGAVSAWALRRRLGARPVILLAGESDGWPSHLLVQHLGIDVLARGCLAGDAIDCARDLSSAMTRYDAALRPIRLSVLLLDQRRPEIAFHEPRDPPVPFDLDATLSGLERALLARARADAVSDRAAAAALGLPFGTYRSRTKRLGLTRQTDPTRPPP